MALSYHSAPFIVRFDWFWRIRIYSDSNICFRNMTQNVSFFLKKNENIQEKTRNKKYKGNKSIIIYNILMKLTYSKANSKIPNLYHDAIKSYGISCWSKHWCFSKIIYFLNGLHNCYAVSNGRPETISRTISRPWYAYYTVQKSVNWWIFHHLLKSVCMCIGPRFLFTSIV